MSPSPYLDQIAPINTNKHVVSELYAHILAQRVNSHVVFKTWHSQQDGDPKCSKNEHQVRSFTKGIRRPCRRV